jgi:prepilin signal peptidase PulO-like enzyme (type II secretory pathway)
VADPILLASWLLRRGGCACGVARLSLFHPAIELGALAVALTRAVFGERLGAATRIAFGRYLALALWLYGPLAPAPPPGLQLLS